MKIKAKKLIASICVINFTMTALLQPVGVFAAETTKKIDVYGQVISAEYPSKIKSDADLKATVEADKKYYDSLSVPENRDEFGGLKGTKEQLGLNETGFFHIQKLSDGKFVMVDPAGDLYFDVGIGGIGYVYDTATDISGRQNIYQWLPKYDPSDKYYTSFRNNNQNFFSFYVANWIKKYGKPFDDVAYTQQMVDRARKWGFVSGGGASMNVQNLKERPMQQVMYMKMPKETYMKDSTGKSVRLYEVFDEKWTSKVEAAVKDDLTSKKNNKLVTAFMIDNEMQLPKLKEIIPGSKASKCPSKKKLVDILKEKYKNNIKDFDKAWEKKYASFDEVYEATDLNILSDQADADFFEFVEVYLDTYYRIATEMVHKYAPNHMIIGDRLASNTKDLNILSAKVSGKYCDAISYNYYTFDLDMNSLKELSEVSGRPLIMTEFTYGEPTHGLLSAPRVVKTEEEKGLGYRNYVEKCAASGFIVGTHWFEFLDQAATGRAHEGIFGEGYAVGFVDVTDQPYKKALDAIKATNDSIYDVILGKKAPYSFNGFPPEKGKKQEFEIPKAKSPIVIDGVLDKNWPKGDIKSISDMHRVFGIYEANLEAKFQFAWDKNNLYVFADVMDSTPMTNKRTGANVWDGDCIELFIGPEKDKIDSAGALKVKDSQVIAAAGNDGNSFQYFWGNGRTEQAAIKVFTKMKPDKSGYTIETAIPMKSLNIDDPADGRPLRFDFGFGNGTSIGKRTQQFMWNGTGKNSTDRSDWGKATLVNVASIKDSASGFNDLQNVSWAKESIEELAKRNIVSGVGDNKFDPDADVTRAAFTKMLMEALNLVDNAAQADFTDVPADNWSYKYVASAQKKEIVSGIGDGTFGADNSITRQQMVAIAYRAAKVAGVELPQKVPATDFADQNDIEQYAKDPVSVLQQAGIISGTDGRFAPNDTTTRAQAAKIIYSLLMLKH